MAVLVDVLLFHQIAGLTRETTAKNLDKFTCDGRSPLHTAAWTANVHAIKHLLVLAPNLAWQRNEDEMTPLELLETLIEEPKALQLLAVEIGRNGGRRPSREELIRVVELLGQAPQVSGPTSNICRLD